MPVDKTTQKFQGSKSSGNSTKIELEDVSEVIKVPKKRTIIKDYVEDRIEVGGGSYTIK